MLIVADPLLIAMLLGAIAYNGSMQHATRKFSVIGLRKPSPDKVKFYHCPIHQGVRLLPMSGPMDEGWYKCPQCGMPYNPSQVKSDTKITSKFSVHKGMDKPLVTLTKKKHKLYDAMGNEIPDNDADIRQDIAHGASIIHYHTTEDL